ncbi:MAG: hypothetical protein AB7G17_00445 [Phycisphaerales bacterium]
MKPVKIALVVLGPLVLIVGVYLSVGRGGTSLASRMTVMDVTTGEIKMVSKSSVKTLPAQNKDGVRSLFPVVKNEAGVYVIPDRFREAVEALGKEHALQIDPQSLTQSKAP